MITTPSILLLDDGPEDLDLLRAAFADAQFPVRLEHRTRVDLADGGPSLRDRPQLVMLDVWMRSEDGLDLLRRLREAHRDLPVIVYSAALTPRLREACERLRATACLAKPADYVGYDDLVFTLIERLALSVDDDAAEHDSGGRQDAQGMGRGMGGVPGIAMRVEHRFIRQLRRAHAAAMGDGRLADAAEIRSVFVQFCTARLAAFQSRKGS